jgi:hypothetical protein
MTAQELLKKSVGQAGKILDQINAAAQAHKVGLETQIAELNIANAKRELIDNKLKVAR